MIFSYACFFIFIFVDIEILESSLQTFNEGKELLTRLKEMNIYSEQSDRSVTASSACHSIEQLLEVLNDRRRHLEDQWHQKRVKLEQCIQICFLRDEIGQFTNWIVNHGFKYLEDARLGSNYHEALELQQKHNQFEKDHNKPLHDNVMRCLRTADQFIHTGLQRADQAHQEAHSLLEKWEKFALKMDQRRKLLCIVASFYKQTEEASERLNQIKREIQAEEQKTKLLSEGDKRRRRGSSGDEKTSSLGSISPNLEIAQHNVHLSNQLAEISAPGLREGRIVLEKIGAEFESEDVIRRVYEFTEQVKDLKTKLTNDTQDKVVRTAQSDVEERRMTEIIEFENKYNNIVAWMTNIGESFLTQHRDMGVDVAYVSDYLDNHQQMAADLKENEAEFRHVKEASERIVASTESKELAQQIVDNISQMEQKWNKLKRCVDERIKVGLDYLRFVKLVNQFRVASQNLQELFKTINQDVASSSVFEAHVQEKLSSYRELYDQLIQSSESSIDVLKRADHEILKLNSNHMISDIEIMVNEANSLFNSIKSTYEIWRERLNSKLTFKEEWQEFMVNARKMITKTTLVEENFFSKSTSNFESSLQVAESYQQSLDEFMPTIKVIFFSLIL